MRLSNLSKISQLLDRGEIQTHLFPGFKSAVCTPSFALARAKVRTLGGPGWAWMGGRIWISSDLGRAVPFSPYGLSDVYLPVKVVKYGTLK